MSPTSVVDIPILPAAWLFIFFMVAIMAVSIDCEDFVSPSESSIIMAAPMAAMGLIDILAGILRRTAAHGLEHGDTLGIDVPAGSDAETALDHGAQVRDDVAEEVLRHGHIEPFGVLHEPHVRGINMIIVALELGILLRAHLFESPVPEVAAMGQHVPLVNERDRLCGVLWILAFRFFLSSKAYFRQRSTVRRS